jgi:hypothetical protein
LSRWFRFYDDAINDPKVLKLSDKTYRVWVGMLCLASKGGGVLPHFDDMVLLLRMKASQLQPELEHLILVGLLDHGDGGISPHNWNARQYKSDVSTERVKRFRNGERNVSETPPDTEQITEQKQIVSGAFDDFWKAYPRRDGANPKEPARKLFLQAVKGGADPEAIIAGARRCGEKEARNVGTPYIPQAVKWLRDRRWEDYNAAAVVELPNEETQKKLWVMFLEKWKQTGNWDSRNIPAPWLTDCPIPKDLIEQYKPKLQGATP